MKLRVCCLRRVSIPSISVGYIPVTTKSRAVITLQIMSFFPLNNRKTIGLLEPVKRRVENILEPIKRRIESISVENPGRAHRIVSLIPADCPFERDLKLFGRVVAHIPPMCKLNPLYEELVMLRFKAMCYLVDECGEDAAALG